MNLYVKKCKEYFFYLHKHPIRREKKFSKKFHRNLYDCKDKNTYILRNIRLILVILLLLESEKLSLQLLLKAQKIFT